MIGAGFGAKAGGGSRWTSRVRVSAIRRVAPAWVAVVALAAGTACGSTRMIHPGMAEAPLASANRELRGNDVRLLRPDGTQEVWGRTVLASDSLSGIERLRGQPRTIPIAALQSLAVRSAAAGGKYGAGWGFLAGAAAGLAWGISAWDEDHLLEWSNENSGSGHPSTGRKAARTLGAAAALGGAGGLAGIPVGMLLGAEVRFVVRAEP